jgi:hypothetical protein
MREFLSDLLRYAWTVFLWWLAVFGCITTLSLFSEKFRKGEVSLNTYLWIAAGCYIVAAFIVWRIEHTKVRGKDRRQMLTNVMDLVDEVSIWKRPDGNVARYETIGALIHLSEDFGSEGDVVWVCNELQHTELNSDPFGFYELKYGRGAFRRKRLKFLRDARVSGRPIKNDEDALNYIYSVWGDKHGLIEETTGERRLRFTFMQVLDKWSKKGRN